MQKVKWLPKRRFAVGRRAYSLALEIGGITAVSGITKTERLAFWAQAESSSQLAKFIQEIRKGPTPAWLRMLLKQTLKTIRTSKFQIKH